MVDILDNTFDTPTPTPRPDELNTNKRNQFSDRINIPLINKSPSSTTPEDLYNEMIKKYLLLLFILFIRNSHLIATKRLNNRKFSLHGEQLKRIYMLLL